MPQHDGRDDERMELDASEPSGRHRLAKAARICDRILHALGRSVFILAPVIMLSVLVLGLGYVRLRHGPMSLKFLVAPIERGIDAELDGSKVRVDDVLMSLSETGGLEFQLQNVRLQEADGDTVASAPLAAVKLSTAALWSGRIVPARVELIEPRLFLYYSDGGGLSLSFPRPLAGDAAEVGTWTTQTNPPASAAAREATPMQVPVPVEAKRSPAGPLKRIDLARVITQMSARARRRLDASSYLKAFGLRNATVVLEYNGRSTEWRVPKLGMDLRHERRRSVIAGQATIASGGRPWELSFESDEAEGARTLNLKTTIRHLVPRSLAPAVPELSLLQAFDMPIGGDATLQLSSEGDIRAATLSLDIGKGSLRLPALPEAPLDVDGGTLKVAYDGAAQRVTLSPSTLRWRGSRITLNGTLASENGAGARDPHPAWNYQISSREGVFAAEEFGVQPVALRSLQATGRILPHRGEIVLSDFNLKAGDAEIALKGDFVSGVDPASTRLEGRLGPMRLGTLKALWPKAIAPGARDWIGEQLLRADVDGGSFQFVSGEAPDADGTAARQHHLAFALDAANLEMRVIDNMPTVTVPRAMMRIDNDKLTIDMPEAAIQVDAERTVPIKDGRFSATEIMGDLPLGEITFASQTSLAMVLELLERSPLRALEEAGLPRQGIEGQFAGTFRVGLPLLADLQMSAIKLQANARISEGRANALLGPYKVEGASIDLDITEKAVDASGEMLVNGVLAKLGWQRIFDAPLDKQPPLRITATLEDNDRTQLGLDVNHIVQGEVPVEITVTQGVRDEPEIRLRADLGNADLVLANVSWRKPPGRAATLQCDIATGANNQIELQNFKVAGDDVAIEGWAAIDADNRLHEFYFPDFSLNVITRMEVQGKLGPDNVWKVKATGPTFDGRDFFRSLFSLGQLAAHRGKPKKAGDGIDLEAQIGTVIGFSDVSLRGVKMSLSKRGEKLNALSVRGTLDGGSPLAVELRQEQGKPRKLLADATDAGQAFKLIDFYPRIEGGRVRLEVNMDGSGPAEKTGTLWVEKFRILGDPVVSEVFGGAEAGAKKKRQVVHQVFDFDLMYVPFSVGYGQFVMGKSSLRGPMLGATISGKVDFKSRRVNLGGSYIPLQGLQALPLCQIPIVGTIITGQGCEGVSGITFAIQGPMDRPDVIVNPLSMLAPGIFREIFQMTNPNQKVLRRDETPSPDSGDNARSSSTTIDSPPPRAGTIDGWNSQTIENGPTRKQ
jgi:AsmA-like C-terminal region